MGFAEAGCGEWLIRTVMALYTEVCTVVRTDAGLSEGLHHLLWVTLLTLGCLAASNCQPGHHGVSSISNNLHGPGCC